MRVAQAQNFSDLHIKTQLIELRGLTGFPKFTDYFLEDVEGELSDYKSAMIFFADADQDRLEDSKKYNDALSKKFKKNGGRLADDKTWKDDTSETDCRVWLWWNVHHSRFTNLQFMVMLVGLIQVSSASAERVFSQLKLVLSRIQDSALRDNITCRVMDQVNRRKGRNCLKPSLDPLLTMVCGVGAIEGSTFLPGDTVEDSDNEPDDDENDDIDEEDQIMDFFQKLFYVSYQFRKSGF